jgi:hypothetical protein
VKGPSDAKRNVPLVDLGTLKETLAYIRDDLADLAGFERAAELVGSALRELEAADRSGLPRSIIEANLRPRHRH